MLKYMMKGWEFLSVGSRWCWTSCVRTVISLLQKKWLYRRRRILWSGLQKQNQQPWFNETSGWGLIREMPLQNVTWSIAMNRSLRQVVLKALWCGGPHISKNQIATTIREAFQSISTQNWLTLHHRNSGFYTQSYFKCFVDFLNGTPISCKLGKCYKEQTNPTDWFFLWTCWKE